MPCSIAADVRTRLMTEWAVPSIGPALFGNEIAVRAGDGRPADACEEGEILVAGHNVMAGYWNAPLETASALRDGWLHTGDLGFYAEINGVNYYFISGRLKEIIIRYGESLGPPTIEKEVCALAQLGRFAVCGFRNEAAGEEIGVYVQACASEHNLAQVRAILMKCALRYRPRAAIVGLGDIPATVTGKIKRSQLAKQFDGFAAIAFVGTPRVVAAETFSNTALFPTARGGLDYEN